MAMSRSSLALDTPSLLASSAGVFGAKLIFTFLGTVILQLNCTLASAKSRFLDSDYARNDSGRLNLTTFCKVQ
jgi:hypothetical protein